MGFFSHKFTLTLFFFIGLLFLYIHPVFSQQIRKPLYSGRFYPQNPTDLISLINNLTEHADQTPFTVPSDATLRGIILPHAGYIYSGFTTAHSAGILKNTDFNKIIIIGPDHRVGFSNCAISDVDAYETPLGKVTLHPDCLYLKQNHKKIFQTVIQSDELEHSIEVQIPFLQCFLKKFQIVPIVMGPGDILNYAEAIAEILDPETLIVVSSDLSHYLPYQQAVETDRETIDRILALDSEALSKTNNRACGIIPIQVLSQLAMRNHWVPYLLHYSNSGDRAGSKDRVVGYAAIAYFDTSGTNKHKGKNQMNKKQGKTLLQLARKTIADRLNIPAQVLIDDNSDLSDKAFDEHRGTFVTLTINNRLRGCIGNLSAEKSIIEGIRDNAVNAAFHDPRFPPLSKSEFNKVDIEISLLSEPKKLEYQNSDDLLEKLRPNIDGVIIRKGSYSSTFLPQVWDQLPDKQSFLEHLCQKAGLPSDEWRRPGLDVMVYQVQYFEENQ
jgi:AmmeMemoRadiSam system protein B/AmmeMemoRadiSam system protein A